MLPKRLPPTKKRPNKLLIGLAVIVVAGAVLAGLELTDVTHFFHSTPTSDDGPTSAEKKEEAKVDSQKKAQAITHPIQGTPSPAPAASSISLSTHEESNSTVTVTTNLGDVADGTCALTVTNGSSSKTYTAAVIYQPQYSTCAGFSVPISDVGTGSWTLSLSVTSNGSTATQTATAEVN